MAEMAKSVGERLEEIRKREGMSQGQFCDFLGISRSSLQNYVRGERDVPTSILSTLLEKLSIDPSWMIQGENSEAAMKQKADILAQIREIGLAVEKRAAERQIKLTSEERWRLVSQICTLAAVQADSSVNKQTTSSFFLDNMFESNGFG